MHDYHGTYYIYIFIFNLFFRLTFTGCLYPVCTNIYACMKISMVISLENELQCLYTCLTVHVCMSCVAMLYLLMHAVVELSKAVIATLNCMFACI